MIKTIIRNLLKPLSFLPAILMMYLIFSFSAQDGATSAQLSYKVSYKMVETAGDILGADFEPWEIESLANRFHGPIRKIAHMTEYFALAVSVAFPLYVYGLRGFLLLIVAGLFCVAFACADEYHQSMIAGRYPSKKDVMIDSIGIFAGIIFTRIIGWTGRKTIFRPLAKSKKVKKSKKNQSNCEVFHQQTYDAQPNWSYNNQPNQGYYHQQAINNQPNQGFYNQQTYSNQPNQGYFNQQAYSSQSNQGYFNQQAYNNQPNQGYFNQQVYNNQPNQGFYNMNQSASVYNGQRGPSYYGPPPYDFPPQKKDDTSDRLSEDMSFKKLMHDLKDKKQTERHLSRKPKLDQSYFDLDENTETYEEKTLPKDEPEIEEINLND